MTDNIEFAALRNEGEMRAWLAANGCPGRIATRVIERRANEPGFQQEQPVADTGSTVDKVRYAAIL